MIVAIQLGTLATAIAADLPFTISSKFWSYDGTGQLNGKLFAGTIKSGSRSLRISGEIRGPAFWVSLSGNLCDGALARSEFQADGIGRPASGKLSISLDEVCPGVPHDFVLSIVLPAANLPAPAVASALPAPAQAPPAGPAIDPIDESYVAVTTAVIRTQPNTSAATLKTVAPGASINVMGKVSGQDWYLVGDDKPLGYVALASLVPQPATQPVAASVAPAASPPAPSAAPAASAPAIPPALANLDFGRYQALVIGNDRYENGLPALKTAQADAKAVADTLKTAYGFKVTLLVNASRAQIIGALVVLRKTLTWDDNLLIYYAGHGSYDQAADQGYWLPVDAASDDPTNWVSNTDLTNMLRAMQARHVLVVADSCYSGTLTRDANVQVQGADYIKRMVQKKARTVMTSGGLEPVADSGDGGHSVFAAAFIAALQQNNGIMDAQSFFTKVREPVVLAEPQTPAYSNLRFAGHEGGDFVFVREP
jgi:hypothetical protein